MPVIDCFQFLSVTEVDGPGEFLRTQSAGYRLERVALFGGGRIRGRSRADRNSPDQGEKRDPESPFAHLGASIVPSGAGMMTPGPPVNSLLN